MNYKLEINKGQFNLYSEKINKYIMENASAEEVKIALATEMEYKTKLEIVKLLMTFPHGFVTMNNEFIDNQRAIDDYKSWHREIYQRIGFIDEYYYLIDEKIREIFLMDF